jgi:hypothetical protein
MLCSNAQFDKTDLLFENPWLLKKHAVIRYTLPMNHRAYPEDFLCVPIP